MTFENYYISKNILDHPGQLAITKLSYPRLFVRFNYGDSYFASYEEWKEEIVVIEWLDGERPSEKEAENILTECWNFLALTEREEERLANEIGEEDEYL